MQRSNYASGIAKEAGEQPMTSSLSGDGLTARSRERPADPLRREMAELRAQPQVGEQIDGDALRHRQGIFLSVRRDAVSRQSAHQRHLWPVLRARLPDGHEQVARLRDQKRSFEETLVELRWFGDRDPAVNDITDQFLDCLDEHLDTEADLVARLGTIVDTPLLRRVENRTGRAERLAPQRPHPNLPSSHPFVAALFTPVAVIDRLVDAVEFGPSGS
jgi:hypothetical protein